MLVVLTGKIGSGKTTLEVMFQEHGWFVIDCGSLAKQILDTRIKDYFAALQRVYPKLTWVDVVDKKRFSKLLFSNSTLRAVSNDFVRKFVLIEIKKRIKHHDYPGVIVSTYDARQLLDDAHNALSADVVIKVTSPMLFTIQHLLSRKHAFSHIRRWFLQKEYKGSCIHIYNNSTLNALTDKFTLCLGALLYIRALIDRRKEKIKDYYWRID